MILGYVIMCNCGCITCCACVCVYKTYVLYIEFQLLPDSCQCKYSSNPRANAVSPDNTTAVVQV